MGFDGAGCLKWFSGDGSSVWCQWDKRDALKEEEAQEEEEAGGG